jgi:CDP-diacylglycerol--glycerol-3-phosphate 3-phosphatidyltransferase
MDLIVGIIPWAVVLSLLAIYQVRVFIKGRATSARADREGGSVLLSKHLVEFGLWMLTPVGRFLARFGATPDGVTWFSLVPGIGAGVALAFGWFGVATLLGTIAAFCDSLDGMLARLLNCGSEAGETLDAIVDRYAESAFLAGLMVHYRYSATMSALTALALVGAFMVSYTTAKAEAQQVTPPRGLMRRSERATYMLVGAGLVPFTRALLPDTATHFLREAPMVIVIGAIALIANWSALTRMSSIRRALIASAAAAAPVPSIDIASPATRRDASVSGGLVTSDLSS